MAHPPDDKPSRYTFQVIGVPSHHPTTESLNVPVELDMFLQGFRGASEWSLLDRFNVPGWIRVATDAATTFPVGAVGGGTLPIIANGSGTKIPGVVLGESGPEITRDPWFSDVFPSPVDWRTGGDMAIDWGAVLGGAVDIANRYGQMTSGQLAVASGYGGTRTTIPRTIGDADPPDAVWRAQQRCKRRRSRPMLTPTNMALMHQIGTLPNNANVRIALSKAIRKS